MRLDVCFSLNSNVIQKLKYVHAQKLLEVFFKNGNVQYYHDVPDVIWNEFKEARSHGQYFFNSIRSQYDFSLEPAELDSEGRPSAEPS
jgi:hypothetical protein